MKLTFADYHTTDELTFKRLVLICDELAFFDAPSISLADNLGTVGQKSGLRHFIKDFEGSPVKLIVDEPPNSTFNSGFYHKYFEKDLANKVFLNTIFEGIEKGWITDHLFDSSKTNTSGEFKDYKSWILANREEILATNLYEIERPKEVWKVTNKQEAMFAFKILASTESMSVTSTLFICNKYDNSPVSINPYLNKLISVRLSSDVYNGKPIKARQLGLKLMDCFIPDEALVQITWQDILEFRQQTKAYYEAWSIEINKLEATIFKEIDILSDQDILNLIDSEINPKLFELKNEIRRIRDDRYKNILKTVKNVLISSIALGTLSGLSIPGAIASFIGTNLKTPQLTDDIIDAHFQLKDKQLSNGLTYLLKIQNLLQ